MSRTCLFTLFICCLTIWASCDKNNSPNPSPDKLQLSTALVGSVNLLTPDPVVPAGVEIVLGFNVPVNPASNGEIRLLNAGGDPVQLSYANLDNNRIVTLTPDPPTSEGQVFLLSLSNKLSGASGETFDGLEIEFEVSKEPLKVISLQADGTELKLNNRNVNIDLNHVFEVTFSHDVSAVSIAENVVLVGDKNYKFQVADLGDNIYSITPDDTLSDLRKMNLLFPASLGEDNDRPFQTVSYELYTRLDSTYKFPGITDDELLTLVQSQTFKYFWDFGHPVSGLARERNTSGETVTTGGSGFGLMAMIVAVERGFITRDEALDRWETIFSFLEKADRFHGAWPHWLNGTTGKVRPFSEKDDGGDLVETAFLVQGMIAVRQYLNPLVTRESELIDLINTLWHGVEWDWYTRGGGDLLFWHWSPNFGWEMNLPIRGHNETQIIYTLAAASPTHSIDSTLYETGYARSGNMQNGNSYYGYVLPVGYDLGGPLFFAHYSYLGMDPRNLEDAYASYWEQNRNHTLINLAYCIDNPGNYVGYSDHCWGLTASDGDTGYSAHSPTNDRGVVTPTAAISSIPYTPEESLAAIRHFYYLLGDRLWGEYGFYDAFNPTAGWFANSYLAIDQGPIICMIENYRTGLLWDLYMSAPEVQAGLDRLGFSY